MDCWSLAILHVIVTAHSKVIGSRPNRYILFRDRVSRKSDAVSHIDVFISVEIDAGQTNANLAKTLALSWFEVNPVRVRPRAPSSFSRILQHGTSKQSLCGLAGEHVHIPTLTEMAATRCINKNDGATIPAQEICARLVA